MQSEATLSVRRVLAREDDMARMLRRMAHQLVEAAAGSPLALVGIRTGGLVLAERLKDLIASIDGAVAPPLGAVDIALYRDDVFRGLPKPQVGPTELPFSLAGHIVVLVDDVLYTGRTVRAALDALMDFGRPRGVQLAVLVDRGHRELPIQADYIGLTVETLSDESVKVELRAEGGSGAEQVVLRGMPGPTGGEQE